MSVLTYLHSVDDLLDTNQEGLRLLKRFEGFRANWYRDSVNVWTIGYGTSERASGVSRETLPGPITRAEAEKLMVRLLVSDYEPAVEEAVRVELTRNQFAALVSFSYNVGAAAFWGSTLVKRLNRGDTKGAAAQFTRWVYAGGNVVRGLVLRRRAERALFEDDVEGCRGLCHAGQAVHVNKITPRAPSPEARRTAYEIVKEWEAVVLKGRKIT